ncbi:glycosylphosphatidylinositol anchor attachment 1 protein [Anthonomus grandis grandis]|uniref:glycosylphosphatidylinositol anchor attachment 1 protein n=1 Tax=Anthonomus grandis grandis TaxID=2921223 RepID=UPI002165D2A6|nr:glycosylphosphatidylinositol anchor attachment 1 protein [Anthonomus grandis grandis]
MGLLTNPQGGQGKLTKILLKYYGKLCVLLYLAGVVWFCALASPQFNSNTYFSENALLPGLVKSSFSEERAAKEYYRMFSDEAKKYDNSIPYPLLLAQLKQIGIDAYTHNFTLHSPLNPKKVYHGRNVYGILRAPRAASTEALVLSVPYRTPSSIYPTTLPSIGILLAFAKFAAREKYWAKDIIFLITDHEQLGMQAWLEAYYGVTCGNEDILDHGKLRGRAGAIQAAINLELHGPVIGQIDIKIEGLNGQLPNLDLFNLASKICVKEGIYYTFKDRKHEYHRDTYKEWKYHFKNMLSMISTQATGIPNGNHGLFLRFGVQALTLEGFEKAKGGVRVSFLSIGRLIEGIFRSMNNLLERFHQSFFFYILPSSDRYISIGLYMPAACMIAAAVIIKACAKWHRHQENKKDNLPANYIKVVILFVALHICGAFIMALPELLKPLLPLVGFEAHTVVFWGLFFFLFLTLFIPQFLNDMTRCQESLNLLCMFGLLELGTTMIALSMNNIALGIIWGTITVPVALIIEPSSNKYFQVMRKVMWVMVHPLLICFTAILCSTIVMFMQDSLKDILLKAVDATQQAVIYSIIDSMIYGNWLYTVVTMVFIPNWLCFWFVTSSKLPKNVLRKDKSE